MENFRPSRPAEKCTSQRYGRKTGRSTGCRGPPQAMQTADNRQQITKFILRGDINNEKRILENFKETGRQNVR